jgi:hypothetical protein
MLILPDRNVPRAKILMPVKRKEWMLPSQTQPKDFAGNENRTRFRIVARANDGGIVWKGFFDDRDDFDAFLYAIALGNLDKQPALWDLPTPSWQPWMGELISYEFATIIYITSPTNNSSPTTRPTDWSNSNTFECIGGGSGGNSGNNSRGGGGGAYAKSTNIVVYGNFRWYIGSGGGANSGGNPSWIGLDGTVAGISTSYCGAAAGGGSGGQAADSLGNSLTYSGGNPGSTRGGSAGSGGGAAAGASGAGGAGGSNDNGGSGAGGGGGANGGGSGGGGTSGSNGSGGSGNNGGGSGGSGSGSGGNGTNIGGGYGSGGGGGGIGGNGGYYGGGGGGQSGSGRQGLVVITYTPVTSYGGNLPNLGM